MFDTRKNGWINSDLKEMDEAYWKSVVSMSMSVNGLGVRYQKCYHSEYFQWYVSSILTGMYLVCVWYVKNDQAIVDDIGGKV